METKTTVLVTGASSGIGLMIATLLHENGYQVFGTSRNPGKHQDKVPFPLLELDVTSDSSISQCLDTLTAKAGGIDVLVNNAGGILAGMVEETPIEQAYEQFETNFWGAVKITKAVLPIMRKQRGGKIISTGSLIGLIGVPGSAYYSASKHAIEGFFKSLRMELKAFNIHVSVLEPGFFRTNIGNASASAPSTISDYSTIGKKMSAFFEQSIAKAPTAEPVAQTVLRILQTKKPKYNYPVGANTKLLPAIQFISHNMFESGFAKAAGL